jgi:hypothetical protein
MTSQIETETETLNEVENPCPVCLETMNGKNQFTTLCGHQFCASCILNNVEYANSCPLCRAEVGIELPSRPVNILPSVNETRAVGGRGRNPRVYNQNRTMHLIEVDSVIDHLSRTTSTTLTHARHMVWNDVALLFNQVFTGGNQSIDRPTHEMLQRALADIAHRDFGDALQDFITNDIRTYLSDVIQNLEIDPEIDDILNNLDNNNNLQNINDNINGNISDIFSIQNYILENFDNTNIINEINTNETRDIEEVD